MCIDQDFISPLKLLLHSWDFYHIYNINMCIYIYGYTMTQTRQISGLIHSKKYLAELFMSMYIMGVYHTICTDAARARARGLPRLGCLVTSRDFNVHFSPQPGVSDMRHVNPVDLKMCNECNALITGIHLNTTMHHCSGQPPNQLAKFSHGFWTQKNTFRSTKQEPLACFSIYIAACTGSSFATFECVSQSRTSSNTALEGEMTGIVLPWRSRCLAITLVSFSSKKDERGMSWTAFLCQVVVRLQPWWRAWSGGTGQTLHIQVVLAQPLLDQIALHLRWNAELGTEKPFLRTKLLNIEVLVKLTARLCSGCRDTQASYFHVERPWKLLSALHWPLHTHCAFPTPAGCLHTQSIRKYLKNDRTIWRAESDDPVEAQQAPLAEFWRGAGSNMQKILTWKANHNKTLHSFLLLFSRRVEAFAMVHEAPTQYPVAPHKILRCRHGR